MNDGFVFCRCDPFGSDRERVSAHRGTYGRANLVAYGGKADLGEIVQEYLE